MEKFRQSIYDPEQVILREWLIKKRKEANFTQRELAAELDVIHSLVGKVEKGERRLEVMEFIQYCRAMNADPNELINLTQRQKHNF